MTIDYNKASPLFKVKKLAHYIIACSESLGHWKKSAVSIT
jgi:hypothetical protein